MVVHILRDSVPVILARLLSTISQARRIRTLLREVIAALRCLSFVEYPSVVISKVFLKPSFLVFVPQNFQMFFDPITPGQEGARSHDATIFLREVVQLSLHLRHRHPSIDWPIWSGHHAQIHDRSSFASICRSSKSATFG